MVLSIIMLLEIQSLKRKIHNLINRINSLNVLFVSNSFILYSWENMIGLVIEVVLTLKNADNFSENFQ